ncbi:MAG: translation initiation factor 2 (IF-2, GTPase) [Pseudomonas sp.]|uniref:translation initiation factor 2 (IF-2, GTPase) n=1 Tax=Pseudomonas sp. TaxID=306 RepID=UPI00339B8DBD
MHSGPLRHLLLLCCLASPLRAEPALESEPGSAAPPTSDALVQQLAESERQRAELALQLQAALAQSGRDTPQLVRLRQDNQRLKLQLREAQAGQPPRLLTEQQLWFALGAAVTLTATLLGALLRGRRKSRREWSN